jgi:hypothetical protein
MASWHFPEDVILQMKQGTFTLRVIGKLSTSPLLASVLDEDVAHLTAIEMGTDKLRIG